MDRKKDRQKERYIERKIYRKIDWQKKRQVDTKRDIY